MAPPVVDSSEIRRLQRLGLDPRIAREVLELTRKISKAKPPPVPETVPKVTGIYAPERRGVCEVDYFYTSPRQAHRESLVAAVNDDLDRMAEPGIFARLLVNGQLMMTDAPMERRTNAEVVERAHGDVLIAGLGLGMILMPIVQNPKVKRVLVVEKYKDVVDVIEPQLRKALGRSESKLAIMIDDVITMDLPKRGSQAAQSFQFDIIYFDIWPTVGVDNLKDISLLRRRFKPFIKDTPDAWMSAWLEEHLKARKKKGLRY